MGKSAPLQPLVFVDGDEPVLVDEAVAALVERALPATGRDFNYDRLSGAKTRTAQVVEAAQQLPAFAERRVVLVTEADKLDLSDELEAYIASPNPHSVLILRATAKFDARGRVYKRAKKAGFTLRFGRPKPREMPKIIQDRARQLGVKVEPAAARSLADAVGADVGAARQALEVLALYVDYDPKRAIRSADVAKVISTTREENIFELVDAIGRQDEAAALRGLHGMLRVNQEHPLRVMAMVTRQYRNLLIARSGLNARWPKAQLQSAVGVPPFVLDKLLAQARGYSVAQLAAQLRRAEVADRAMKGGALDPAQDLERLVFALIGGARAA